MKREAALEGLFFFLAAFCLWAGFRSLAQGSTFEWSAREAGVLRVVTWNVGSGLDRRAGLQDEDLEHVAHVLKQLDPDLCSLQELISTGQLLRLRSLLGDGWSARISSDSDGRRVALLAQRGELAGLASSGNESRSMLGRYVTEEQVIYVAGIHADAFSAEARNKQLGDLVRRLQRLTPADLWVLMGDFNLDLDLDKRRDLFSDDDYLDVETYNYVATRMQDAALGSGSTAEPDRRLDYIFRRPQERPVLRAGPWKGQRAPQMDHDPVVVDLAPLP